MGFGLLLQSEKLFIFALDKSMKTGINVDFLILFHSRSICALVCLFRCNDSLGFCGDLYIAIATSLVWDFWMYVPQTRKY